MQSGTSGAAGQLGITNRRATNLDHVPSTAPVRSRHFGTVVSLYPSPLYRRLPSARFPPRDPARQSMDKSRFRISSEQHNPVPGVRSEISLLGSWDVRRLFGSSWSAV